MVFLFAEYQMINRDREDTLALICPEQYGSTTQEQCENRTGLLPLTIHMGIYKRKYIWLYTYFFIMLFLFGINTPILVTE